MSLQDEMAKQTGTQPVTAQIVEFVKLDDRAIAPSQAYEGDAGWDLFNLEDVTLWPRARRELRTGLAIHIPDGHYGRVCGRSSAIRRHNVMVYEGVADSGFRGEWTICVELLWKVAQTFPAGTSLAQLIVSPFTTVQWQKTNKLTDSVRGERGYGSSG